MNVIKKEIYQQSMWPKYMAFKRFDFRRYYNNQRSSQDVLKRYKTKNIHVSEVPHNKVSPIHHNVQSIGTTIDGIKRISKRSPGLPFFAVIEHWRTEWQL